MNVLRRIALVTAAAALLAGCGSTGVSISAAYVSPDDTQLWVILNACDNGAKVDASETGEQVDLTASVPRRIRLSSNDCLSDVVVTLESPLASRTVVDAQTGDSLVVLPAPDNVDWNG